MSGSRDKEVYVDLVLQPGIQIFNHNGLSVLLNKVETFSELSNPGNRGMVYLVLDEMTFYAWDSATETYIVPSAFAKGFTNGCRLVYTSLTTISVASGMIEVKGTTLQRTSPLDLTWSNVESGVTRQANKWYYVYLQMDPSNKKQFIGFISDKSPTRDQYYNSISPDANQPKYHPTLDARFVGSFRTDASMNILNFKVIGNHVIYVGISNYNYILQKGALKTRTGVNCRTFVPVTSSLCNVYYELSSGTNLRYVGDSTSDYLKAIAGSGTIILPVTNNSIYYYYVGNNISLGIHGYYEDM
jgi:hypothetical protein